MKSLAILLVALGVLFAATSAQAQLYCPGTSNALGQAGLPVTSLPYTVSQADTCLLKVFNSSASGAVFLPAPSPGSAFPLYVLNQGAGTLTVSPLTGDNGKRPTINGGATLTIPSGFNGSLYWGADANWYLTAGNPQAFSSSTSYSWSSLQTFAGGINSTSSTGYQINGGTGLMMYGTGSITFGPANCPSLCSLLVGTGAGAALPSNDYITTAVGWGAAGKSNIQRPEITAVGWHAAGEGAGATFNFLAAFGINALGNCTANCSTSVAIGTDAARDATLFTNSVAVGNGAGVNGVFDQSTLVGSAAGNWNSSYSGAGSITALGYRAGFGNNATTAAADIFVGNSVGSAITTGSKNVFVGDGAGQSATTMAQSVLVGWKAGALLTTSQNNTIVGALAASNGNPGANNTIYGFNDAANMNSSATNNVVVGDSSGTGLTSGTFNILIGSQIGNTCTTCTGNVIIGSDVLTAGASKYTSMGGVRGYNQAPTNVTGFGNTVGQTFVGNTFAFAITVGAAGTDTTGTIAMPAAAATAWDCTAEDKTTHSTTVFVTRQLGVGTTSQVTLGNFTSADVAAPWVAGDVIGVKCLAR